MIRRSMTVSMPPEILDEVERVRKRDHRTRSELVREALRAYLGLARPYVPTPSEMRAIERGRAALRRGESLTLDEFRAGLGGPRRKARPKKRGARSPT